MRPRTLATLSLAAIAAGAFTALVLGIGATPGHDGLPPATAVTADAAPTLPHALDCADYATGDAPSGPGIIPGACYLPTTTNGYQNLDTAEYGTDIPRCASDDSNTDHVGRCYTERVTDGAIVLLTADDHVIVALAGA